MDTLFDNISLNEDDAHRGIAFMAADGSIEFSNKRFCDMLGLTRNEVHGLMIADIVHPDDVIAQKPDIERFINKEIETFEANQRVFHKDGTMFWVHKSYHRFYNDNNELIYWVMTYQEIPNPLEDFRNGEC
jgi:PAS domain S-box-containing protein